MPKGVYIRTDRHRAITSKAMAGRTLSESHKAAIKASSALSHTIEANLKRSVALAGKPKALEHTEKVRLANLGQKRTIESKLKMSLAHLGKKLSEDHARKSAAARIGTKHSPEFCARLSASRMGENNPMYGVAGPIHHNWIADRTKLALRSSTRTMADFSWSESVKRRDKRRCVLSEFGKCDGKMVAHHIRPWKEYPESRYDVANGVTLCQVHHPIKRSEAKALETFFNQIVSGKEG